MTAQAAANRNAGTIIGGKYAIEQLIGSGAGSQVYRAQHLTLKVAVAIKFCDRFSDQSRRARFEHEAKTAHGLVHPNLLRLLDYSSETEPYIVMELIDGSTLAELIERNGAVPVTQALTIFAAICAGLEAAHQSGLIHRDIKPTNIMIERATGVPRIIDFGLVKDSLDDRRHTATGEVVGSPAYMSPEQCKGEPLDARSDIYSLGCTLLEVLTNRRAFDGANPMESMLKHMEMPAPSPAKLRPDLDFPKGLDRLILRCLEKEPVRRYQSVHEVRQDIELLLTGKGGSVAALRQRKHGVLFKFIALPLAIVMGSILAIGTVLLIMWLIIFAACLSNIANRSANGPNQLSLGPSAPERVVQLALHAPSELNKLSVQQLLAVRRRSVDEHKDLLTVPYKPFVAAFPATIGSGYWLGRKGFYWGHDLWSGPSIESECIINPFLLVAASWDNNTPWDRQTLPDPDMVPDFPYDCLPQNLRWNTHARTMDVTYDVTAWEKRLRQLKAVPQRESLSHSGWLRFYNARDLGFCGIEVSQTNADGRVVVLTAGRQYITQSLANCRVEYGQAVSNGSALWRFNVSAGSTICAKLWRDANSTGPADMVCTMHFK